MKIFPNFQIFLFSFLSVSVARSDISVHGSSSEYAESGGNWLSMGSNDIDESGGLGSDGWFFFGNFNGAQQNGQAFTHHVQNSPTYVSGFAQGANFTSVADEFSAYGQIDNPLLLNGSNSRAGFALSTTGGAGSNNAIISFTVASLPAGTTVRVGVLAGIEGNGDGRWDPTSITLSDGANSATVGSHSGSPLVASPGGSNAGWVFFDLDSNGTYTVSTTKRVASQGSGIGGLTFDSTGSGDITDPTDSEPDGMGDNWEIFYFGDLSRDGSQDFDNDGRSDRQEWEDGTNPVEADIDEDGLSDGDEFSFGTDPFDNDSDDDGFDDGEEIEAGSDPNDESSEPTVSPAPDVYASVPQPTRDAVVVFSEIHYHPAGDDTSLEYIELYNQMAVDVDLSNWRLRGDADFDFPEGTVIEAGAYLVVASDPAALALATGHSSALGPLSGELSNGGGRLRLYNNNRSFRTLPGGVGSDGEILDDQEGRRVMDEIEYSDVFPWPVGADGSGSTLVKRDVTAGSAHPINWLASVPRNGSPGVANPLPVKPQLVINEVTSSDASLFQLELYNYGASTISLGGMSISSSNPLHAPYSLPFTSLAPGAFLSIDATSLGFSPEDNNRLFLFSAGQVSLIDAVRVDDRPRARYPDGTGRLLRPDVGTFGDVNSFDFEDDLVINEIFYSAPAKSAVPAVPGEFIEHPVLGFSSSWRYNLDAGVSGLPADWANAAHVVDNVSWAEGPGLLGFEPAVLGEPILTPVPRSFVATTYYFESDFVYSGSGSVTEMDINHYLDDGAVFYLNGVEIGRLNLPEGAVTPSTPASSSVGNAVLQTLRIIDPPLVVGMNRFSVEVHQDSPGSSDMVWGAEVTLFEDDGTGIPEQPYLERDEEWLELYNRGTSSLDLSGWRLSGGIRFDFPLGTTIPAGSYLVVAKDAAALAAKHPAITIVGDYDQSLGNGGDLVVLEDSSGNPADEVRYYDAGSWHDQADGGGSSLELRDPDSDNRIAGAWAASDETSRTSWQTFTYEGVATDDGFGDNIYHELQLGLLDAGELLLDDVSVTEDPNGAAIELIQNGDFESDALGGTADKWRAIGNHGSHGNTVVVTDPSDPGNRCLHLISTGATENRHNKLETTFANSEEIVVGNTYRIQFRVRWLSGVNLFNSRFYFNYLQRTHILERPEIWGTPGMVNSTAVANAGPVLSGLQHSPVVPNAGETTVVSVTASDLDGMGDLDLFYSINSGGFQNTTMLEGSDGRYHATIPGQSASAIVRFYVRGQDAAGATSFFPEDAAASGAFYKVQDNLAHTGGLRHNFRIIMAESDRQFLFLNTNRMSNDRFPVTVIENESTIYYNVGARLKASGHGRFQADGYGFNLRFQPDNLFRGVHPGIALERTSNRHELFAKHMLNRAGGGSWSFYDDVTHLIPPTTGDTGICLISMARYSGNYFDGLYPDSDETGTLFNQELHYSPNGTTGGPENLKIGNPFNHNNGQYDFADHGSDKETYRWGFQIRSARERDDFSKIVALNQAFSLEGDALKEALDELIDVNQWMRTFAMASLNGNDDTFGRIWEHNIRYYVRPTDGKVIALFWDLDRCFRLATSGSLTSGLQSVVPSTNRDGRAWSVASMFAIPEYRRLFDGHLEDLVDTTMNSSYLTTWSNSMGPVVGVSFAPEVSYVTNRANFVLSSLPSELPFAITVNNGAGFNHPDSVVELEGRAWIDVFAIEANGVRTPIEWLDGETWRISIPLSPGANPLTITALDNRDTVVGSDTINVVNTSELELASVSNTIISELNYHPGDPSAAEVAAGFDDADLFEFVELTNVGSADVDFTNVAFTDGVDFTFAGGVVLAAGERFVLVADPAAFEFRYGPGTANIVGTYSGSFRNSGEQVRLEAADTSIIADFSYGDSAPWPTAADGGGYSLIFAGGDPSSPLAWRSSAVLGGSPGSGNSSTFSGGDLLAYALASEPVVNIVNDDLIISVQVNLPAGDVSVRAEFSPDLLVWSPSSDLSLISRVNHGDGTATWSFVAPEPVSQQRDYYGRIQLTTQ